MKFNHFLAGVVAGYVLKHGPGTLMFMWSVLTSEEVLFVFDWAIIVMSINLVARSYQLSRAINISFPHALRMIFDTMVYVIIGTQLGDEGKGGAGDKLVNKLAGDDDDEHDENSWHRKITKFLKKIHTMNVFQKRLIFIACAVLFSPMIVATHGSSITVRKLIGMLLTGQYIFMCIARSMNSKCLWVVSGSGGANAGHTVYVRKNGKVHKYNTNIIPASFDKAKMVFLGCKKVLHLGAFHKEITRITSENNDIPPMTTMEILRRKLRFMNGMAFTFIPALMQERINEYLKSIDGKSVGTTGVGISTTMAQYDIKCPIEIITWFNIHPTSRNSLYEQYLKTCNSDATIGQYLDLLKSGKIKPITVNCCGEEKVLNEHFTLSEMSHMIKYIDLENINWFFDNFWNCIIDNTEMFKMYSDEILCHSIAFIFEGVQANGLSAQIGPLNATTSTELDPDILWKNSLGMKLPLSTWKSYGVSVSTIGVIKLLQSSVGNHINLTKMNILDSLVSLRDIDVSGNKLVSDSEMWKYNFGKYWKFAANLIQNKWKDLTVDDMTTEKFIELGLLTPDRELNLNLMLAYFYGEQGTTTGRPRTICWLDLVRIKSSMLGQIDGLALTRLDAFNEFTKFYMCVKYENTRTGELHDCINMKDPDFDKSYRPVYVSFPTWPERIDFTKINSFDELPIEAKNIFKAIEQHLGIPIVSCNLSASKTMFTNRFARKLSDFSLF